jgi:redox-sensitive bicupin YhaK (pirin superfamily)|uniref:pirin family protein n=1 Tax=Halomonas sp. TaxID=1486246 RepID=UPI002627FC85|nr:pirin family protein [Halomonas sp.]
MSNPTDNAEQLCEYEQCSGAIELLIETREKDIGNFSVRRSLPTAKRKMVGPWIFFDHMGPADFPIGEGINVRPHPHVNLATVTYLFEGEILHRDSLGSVQPIRPGDINLMVAGKGITHSERERPEATRTPRRLHGLQLWLALPEEDEEIDPAFYHYPSADIPALEVDGVPLRVMMGAAYGVTSPVKTFAETLYVEAHLQPGQRLALPYAEERAVYTAQGKMKAGVTEIPEHSLAVCAAGVGVTLEAVTECRIGIIGGERLSRRYVDWNFVSSRKERIEQARQDWKSGAFPKVPGDEEEFIPLPE